jgi:hypothetical protein
VDVAFHLEQMVSVEITRNTWLGTSP